MNKQHYAKIAIPAIILGLAAAIFFLKPLFLKNPTAKAAETWQANGFPTGKSLKIIYPFDNSLFPPEIVSPIFSWKDSGKTADSWLLLADVDGKIEYTSPILDKQEWKPESSAWEKMKQISIATDLRITILGFQKDTPGTLLSGAEIRIRTSKDKVGAPIFYRDVPLPFIHAYKHLEDIRWRLGDISSDEPSRVILENLPICGNCHSFSRDGHTMAMDVDYANDKGSYAISGIEKETVLTSEKIITWSDFRKEDDETTFGLLSQISPDGRYVVSTVKDRSIFVPQDDLNYSQLFFPLKGILVYYDRETSQYHALPGADNPEYVQSNPSWSPDGKYLIFARSKALRIPEVENSRNVLLSKTLGSEFIDGKREFKYDLYKLPFNEGKGGEAVPLPGASGDGMSHYFPKISPDGKWLVFCKAANFMLLQPDSKLFIMPAQGGTPREMTCNTSEMNSWHSWSPNGKWLVFSSKQFGPYTQLFLTHIDENGNDSPPVLIQNFILPKRAVNIPEFVDIKMDEWHKLVDGFSNSPKYLARIGGDKFFAEDYDAALKNYDKALEQAKNDPLLYIKRGDARAKVGKLKGAVEDYDSALQLNVNSDVAYLQRGNVFFRMGEYDKAVRDYDNAVRLKPDSFRPYDRRAHVHLFLKNYKAALADLSKALELYPDDPALYCNRANIKKAMADTDGALADYQKAIELNPEYVRAFTGRGNLRYLLKNFKGAQEDYNKAVELDDKAFTAFNGRGKVYLHFRQFDKAAEDFEKALLLKPESWEALIGKGDVKWRKTDFVGAAADYSEAIRLNESSPIGFERRADMKIRLNDFKGALEDLDTAIGLNPGNYRSYSDRGDAKFHLGDVNGAYEDYNRAVELKPGDGESYYKRGMARIRLGQKGAGCDDLHKAVELGYSQASQYVAKFCGN
ncbi:MAG: tetratricopeptide repeat protein [bacterium]|nr:tetratricopeptide repeat protein [bacterium]